MAKTLRELSKGNYNTNLSSPSLEDLNTGSLQRIADATELMAKNHIEMENDLKYYKELAVKYKDKRDVALKSNAALRGHITRLKNRIKRITDSPIGII